MGTRNGKAIEFFRTRGICVAANPRHKSGVGESVAHDDASDAAYSDGLQPGDNGGTGTWGGGWTFRNQSNVALTATDGNRGWFVSSSVNNNTGGVDSNGDGDINTTGNKAWGVYSNSVDQVYAIRPLSGSPRGGRYHRMVHGQRQHRERTGGRHAAFSATLRISIRECLKPDLSAATQIIRWLVRRARRRRSGSPVRV